MKQQEIKTIDLRDLVLWTENPRDPIDPNATDQQVVDRALNDRNSKWSLPKLAKEMGEYYDYSELPTVVYHGDKPVVYDGNRRIVLGKIKHDLVSIGKKQIINLPEFPEKIPCNVCQKKIALQNVLRKHGDSGSWHPLERDIFLYKHLGERKSSFLIIEEDTSLISANPHMNQRFVKEEILKDEALKSMGFDVHNGRLRSLHSDTEAQSILLDLANKIRDKEISTRNHRGKVIEVLSPNSQQTIDQNKGKKFRFAKVQFRTEGKDEAQRQTRRSQKKSSELFGGKLYLRIGVTSDLYRDIEDLYKFFVNNKEKLSDTFPNLIRMSLRLLCETAAQDENKKFEKYLNGNFAEAKKNLDQDIKTTLANQNVNEATIIQLLHTGAHNYKSSHNLEQTIALSIIIGAIITISHGKEE